MFNPKAMTDLRKAIPGADGNELSISQLAKLIGTDRSLVSSWENGRRTPTVESLVRIAEVLGCETDALVLRGEDRKTAQEDRASAALAAAA